MTRKADRQHSNRVGAGEARHYDDASLRPGVSIGGRAPKITAGDRWRSLVLIRCGGCAEVGVFWLVTRPGRELLPVLELQIAEDWSVRPVAMQTIFCEARPGDLLPSDCPAHGRLAVPAGEALAAGRHALQSGGAGDRLPVLDVQPHGTRAEARPGGEPLSMEAMRHWLGWGDDTPPT